MIADRILELLGNTPAAYGPKDKWPVIFADLFFYSLPIIFILLFVAPFIWIFWYKKRPFTLRTFGLTLLKGVGFVFLGLVALFFLASYLQGLAFRAIHGG